MDVIGNSMQAVGRANRANICPIMYPVVEDLRCGDRNVVHVKFKRSRRPYLAYGIPYLRSGGADVQMEQKLYRDLLNERENRIDTWEIEPSEFKIQDIDTGAFQSYLQRAEAAGQIVTGLSRDEIKNLANSSLHE